MIRKYFILFVLIIFLVIIPVNSSHSKKILTNNKEILNSNNLLKNELSEANKKLDTYKFYFELQNKIFSIVLASLVIISLMSIYFGIWRPQIFLKELDNKISKEINKFVTSDRTTQINKALDKLKSKNAKEVAQGRHFFNANHFLDYTNEQLRKIFDFLMEMKGKKEHEFISILVTLAPHMGSKKSLYGDLFFKDIFQYAYSYEILKNILDYFEMSGGINKNYQYIKKYIEKYVSNYSEFRDKLRDIHSMSKYKVFILIIDDKDLINKFLTSEIVNDETHNYVGILEELTEKIEENKFKTTYLYKKITELKQ